jgi:hypothetical protein
LNQTESVLRGALEMAIRCIRGEVPADGFVGDTQLLPLLEKTLSMPDGGEPTLMETAVAKQLRYLEEQKLATLERDAQTPKLRDLFAMAAIQSPIAADFLDSKEPLTIWAYGLADTMLRFRESGR